MVAPIGDREQVVGVRNETLPPSPGPVSTLKTNVYIPPSVAVTSEKKSGERPPVDVVIVPTKTHFDERSVQQFRALVLEMIAQKGSGTDYAQLRKLVGQHDDWGVNIIVVHEAKKMGQAPTVIARPSERRLKPDESHPAKDSAAYRNFMDESWLTEKKFANRWEVVELVNPEGNLVVRIGPPEYKHYQVISPGGLVMKDGYFDAETDGFYHFFQYDYDNEGRLVEFTKNRGGRITEIRRYTYDPDGVPYQWIDQHFYRDGTSNESIFEFRDGYWVGIKGSDERYEYKDW